MENRIGDYDIKKENEMLFNMRLKTYKNSTPVITINGYYPPSVRDIEKILSDEPKLVESTKEDHSEEIFEHFKRVNEREMPLETLLITLYLREGVDYISSEPYSQRKTRGVVPEEVHESADIQGLMRPISIRTAKQIAQAYKAFTYLAELRGYEGSEDYYFPNTLEILKVVLPYSGCLKSEIIESKYYGNPVLAAKDVVKLIREKFEEKKGDIVDAVVKKRKGELTQDDLEKLDGEWKFMREVLEVLKV